MNTIIMMYLNIKSPDYGLTSETGWIKGDFVKQCMCFNKNQYNLILPSLNDKEYKL